MQQHLLVERSNGYVDPLEDFVPGEKASVTRLKE